nr:c-type cytochrome [Thiocapsa imhoffii]
MAASAIPVSALSRGDPAIGETIAQQVCVACHAPDHRIPSPIPKTPVLAGQHEGYLVKQLRDYRDGKRSSGLMLGFLDGLEAEDFPHVAAYFASLPPGPGVVTDPSLLELGRELYLDGNPERGLPACAGCHGDEGEGSRRFPRLAGQNVDYTVEQMRRYATGERTNDRGLMQTVADRMDEQDILAVAQFVASLVGEDNEETASP